MLKMLCPYFVLLLLSLILQISEETWVRFPTSTSVRNNIQSPLLIPAARLRWVVCVWLAGPARKLATNIS
jgi:hypothetical protein